MMNHPVPSPSEPPAAAPPRRAPSSAPAVVVALLVFGGFVAYAFLVPATFRTTAQIVLKPTGSGPLVLPSAPDPATQLRSAAIDAETLQQMATELGLSSSAAAKQRVDADLEIKRSTPVTFEFSFRASTAARAERVADLLARHAAARAVRSLSPAAPDQNAAREAARTRSAAELATFIAAHPELTLPAPSVVPVAPKDGSETDSAALRAERDQIQAKLARIPEAPKGSDNPFGESAASSPEALRLQRRVAEIDQTLRSRQRAEKKLEPLPKIAPEVDREWKRLLQAVANPVVTETAVSTPAFTVMLREAALPSAPIEPDRRKIALYGGVSALLAAVGVLLLQLLRSRGKESLATTARLRSDPPRAGSEPPRPASDPPRSSSEPPLLGIAAEPRGEPTRRGSEPPLLVEAPREKMPSRPPSEPLRADEPTIFAKEPQQQAPQQPQQKSDPPKPIVALTMTQVLGGTTRTVSSNPPAGAAAASPEAPVQAADGRTERSVDPVPARSEVLRPGSDPPRDPSDISSEPPKPIVAIPTRVVSDRPRSSNPPAAAAPAATEQPRQQPIARPVSTSPERRVDPSPSPLPPPRSAALPRPTPGYEELRPGPGTSTAGTGWLSAAPHRQALGPQEPAAPAHTPAAAAVAEPFATAPSASNPSRARVSLRPAPPDEPKPEQGATTTFVPEILLPPHAPQPFDGDVAPAGRQQPVPTQPDDSWTGPSRAHRRSVQAARRTTQMLGSPIPPIVRGRAARDEQAKEARAEHSADRPSATPPAPAPAPTTYSFVSSSPPPPPRTQLDTPPYHPSGAAQLTAHTTHIPGPPRTGTSVSQPPHARPRLATRMVPATWAPEPGLRPETRRSLSDHFFPLAVESCFVIGVVALSETRNAKSQVAAELALALAEPRHPRVLLLEGDFQWPAVHHVMGIDTPMADGFSHQLHTRAEAGFERWVTIECNPTLHVLAEGILRTPGLILSIQFEQGVRSLRSLYDLIVIDGPDTSSEVECRALANVIDGLVLVAPANAGVELERALDLFPDMRFSTIVPV